MIALFWTAFGFLAFSVYASVAVALAVIVRRRVMEVTCKDRTRRPTFSSDDHLYCATLSGHWMMSALAAALWPIALVPLLVLSRLHQSEVRSARIDRLERELGMKP